VLHGGLFSNHLFYREFENRVSVRFPELVVTKPNVPGAVGAYLLALHEKKIDVSEQMKRNIQQTWRLLEGEVE
jgi:activator of 2-hydroxyglutaryl-CoA dehydratase